MSISDNEKKLFNEINITPLTDIFLVLLIIMMVLAPTFSSMDTSITVPEVNSGVNVENKQVVVSVTKDGMLFVNESQVSGAQLEEHLKSLLELSPDKSVVVKADEKTKSSKIMEIMKAAQVSGYEKLTVAGEPLNKKKQKELMQKANEKTQIEEE
ncbi:MAG: biopolymer transporter ExbD [Candidatus Gastranaerophilales bacterium]|nr:biopolymer transporter ExbD [Candidatus Gastranaerophilales bacterium]